MNEKQKTVYEALMAAFTRFNAADDYLVSCPMWNFGIPYKLKHYIDVLSMPGSLFGFDPAVGYIGLLKGKRATIVSTAAIYSPGVPKAFGTDYVMPYLVDWFNFAGVQDVTSVWYHGSKTFAKPEEAAAALDKALAAAREAGRK